MSRLIISMIIIGACGSFGLLKAHSYSERVLLLDDMIQFILHLQQEIEYRADPLPKALYKIGIEKQTPAYKMAKATAELYRTCRNNTFSQCFSDMFDKIYEGSSLTKTDSILIKEFGSQLGKTSMEGQNKIFEMTVKRLNIQLAAAKNDKETKGKMYLSIGFVIGITIVILLI